MRRSQGEETTMKSALVSYAGAPSRRWRDAPAPRLGRVLAAAAVAALGLVSPHAQSAPAPQDPLGFRGRWVLEPKLSHFDEAVTGPAPGAAELSFTRDDGRSIAWTLVEHDGDSIDATEFGEAPLDGAAAKIVVDGAFAPVKAVRQGPHAVELSSALLGGARQIIRISLKDEDHIVVDETLMGPAGQKADQHLEFERDTH